MLRCAVLDDYQRVAATIVDWSSIAREVELTTFDRHLEGEADLTAALCNCDIVVLMRERTPLRRSLIEQLPRLRLIITTGRSNPSIDLSAAEERGITVCTTGSPVEPTAELTWGLILALARRIPQEDANIRRGGPWQLTLGIDLHGKVLGIIGLGTLGRQVARIGQAFGMRGIAWSTNLTPAECQACGVDYASKDELIERSDVLTIHVRLSEQTAGLIGAEELRRMKPTALLVNTSRGQVVDEAALIDALQRGVIAGAALDVYEEEPLPSNHPLRSSQGTVLTPHIGYVTERSYRMFFDEIVENIRHWLDGTPVRLMRHEEQRGTFVKTSKRQT